MKYCNSLELSNEERNLLEIALDAAQHSLSPRGHKVGAVILCSDGSVYQGATLSHNRMVGSTCAERMAIDQMYFMGGTKPKLLVLVSLMVRSNWTASDVSTPCGVCLDMMWEMAITFDMNDFDIIASSWDQTKIIKTTLFKLFPKLAPRTRRRQWSKDSMLD